MKHICKCTNCDNLLLDTNPKLDNFTFDVDYLELRTLEDGKCPHCNTDKHLSSDVIKSLWSILGDVPCDEEDDDLIDERFLQFEIGEEKLEIWHWFEYKFNISVAKDLMGLD